MNIHNMIGQKFETLTVVRRAKNDRGNQARFVCKCVCGEEHIRLLKDLISGNFEPCGCPKSLKNQEKPKEREQPKEANETINTPDKTDATQTVQNGNLFKNMFKKQK